MNPEQIPGEYNNIFEIERITLTRYRTGSHNLRIEKGRHTYPITPREGRVCKCGDVVQTLRHIILHCPLLQHIRNGGIDDVKFFKSKEVLSWKDVSKHCKKRKSVQNINICLTKGRKLQIYI